MDIAVSSTWGFWGVANPGLERKLGRDFVFGWYARLHVRFLLARGLPRLNALTFPLAVWADTAMRTCKVR